MLRVSPSELALKSTAEPGWRRPGGQSARLWRGRCAIIRGVLPPHGRRLAERFRNGTTMQRKERFGEHRPRHPDRRRRDVAGHRAGRLFGTPGRAVPAGLPGRGHAGRRGRPGRHPLLRHLAQLPGRQPGAGGDPARWRAAHALCYLQGGAEAFAVAGDRGGAGDGSAGRRVRRVAAGHRLAARAAAWCHRRLDRRGRGVLDAQ